MNEGLQPSVAVLSDFDGCIINTLPLWHAACTRACVEHGICVTQDEITQTIVPNLHSISSFGHSDPQYFVNQVLRYFEETKYQALLHDGILDTFTQLKNQGVLLALVTSSGKDSLWELLRFHSLHDIFDTVVTRNDVTHTKPDPEPINVAMQKLGVTEHHALMIGDSPVDIRAAQAAHLDTSVLYYPLQNHPYYTSEFVQSLRAGWVITHFPDLLPIVWRLVDRRSRT